MPRVDSMLELVSRLESPYITVHQDRCQLVRNRNADCLRCAVACTSGCISFDGEELSISPERCIGCGTCATVCPTCCLEAHHPNDAELANRCLAASRHLDGTAVMACGSFTELAKGRFDEEAVVRVECLGRIEESLLATLAAAGVRNAVCVHGDCAACEHRTGRDVAEQVVECTETLMQAWGSGFSVKLTGKLPARCKAKTRDFDTSKRAALADAGAQAGRAAAITADFALRDAFGAGQPARPGHGRSYAKVMEDGTLPHFLPDRRERLLDALATLGQPGDATISTRLWGRVRIDADACTGCRMCATFCPTGALRKFGEDDGGETPFGVEHCPGDCVKCGLCRNICPAHAITIEDRIPAADMVSGASERFEMTPAPVKRGQAHTILELQKRFIPIPEVYER